MPVPVLQVVAAGPEHCVGLRRQCVRWPRRPASRAGASATGQRGREDGWAGAVARPGVAAAGRAWPASGAGPTALAPAAAGMAGAGGWPRAVLGFLMAAGLAMVLAVGRPPAVYARTLAPVEAAPATLEMKARAGGQGAGYLQGAGYRSGRAPDAVGLQHILRSVSTALHAPCPGPGRGRGAHRTPRARRARRGSEPWRPPAGAQAQPGRAVAGGAADGRAVPGEHAVRRQHCQYRCARPGPARAPLPYCLRLMNMRCAPACQRR